MTPTTNPFKAPAKAAKVIKDVAAAAKRRDTALVADDTNPSVTFKAESEGHYRRFGWLPLADLVVDPQVQRPEIPSHINRIAKNFNEDALGTAVVSARLDPATGEYTYVLLDGQQRRAGALLAGFEGNIRADVHYNLTLADEATLFRIHNERKPVQPIQLFKNALIEGDPDAIAVQKILNDLGIPFGTAKGYSGAKSALRLVARRNGGETKLRWALTQVQKIYDAEGDGGCYDASVVEAFYWLYDHHGSRIDEENLYNKLSRMGGGTPDLVGHAKTIKGMRGGRIGTNLIRAIIARYNHDKRSAKTKLPDWTKDVNDDAE